MEEVLWRHLILGTSWETSSRRGKVEFLQLLETDTDHDGIWFDGATTDNGDSQLVADMLEAIRQNPNVLGLCFKSMGEELPTAWLGEMLATGRIQELRIMYGNVLNSSDAELLSQGLQNSTSLKSLCLDYPSLPLLNALKQVLPSETLQLERLDIAGISHEGYEILAPLLPFCPSLKTLILTAGSTVNLDTSISEFAAAIESGCLPLLEKLTFAYGYSSPEACSKLFDALATMDLKFLSVGGSENQVLLADPTPLERMIAANRGLQDLHLYNVEAYDLSEVFGAIDHMNLVNMRLTNVIKTAGNAQDLASALSRNALETLDIVCTGDDFQYEPFVRSLSDGLISSNTLTIVNLNLNQVYDIDLHALSFALEGNNHLKTLRVTQYKDHDRSLDSGLTRLGQSLKHNNTLCVLDLNINVDVADSTNASLLDGVKANSSLKVAKFSWFDDQDKAELHFYVELNHGLKQALYLPLNLMAYAFARADQYSFRHVIRTVGGDGPTTASKKFHITAHIEVDMHEDGFRPPSEMFFLVRERCDLFHLADREVTDSKKQGNTWLSWLCGLLRP